MIDENRDYFIVLLLCLLIMNKNVESSFEYYLDHDFAEYDNGEWLAIYQKKVLSHGMVLKNVVEEAKKTVPLSQILISKVKKTASYL